MDGIDPTIVDMLPAGVRETLFPFASVPLIALLFNLLIGFFLAWVIGLHYRRYASTFCNRQDFSRLFPMLVLSVILIISVVKASLALALGLVGALSIVRFRTAVKEPEELLYLFLCIGIGVSLGAGQTLAAFVASLTILSLVAFAKRRRSSHHDESGLFLSIDYRATSGADVTVGLAEFTGMFANHVERADMRRFDVHDAGFEATVFLLVKGPEQVDALFAELRGQYPAVRLSLLEQHNIAGV